MLWVMSMFSRKPQPRGCQCSCKVPAEAAGSAVLYFPPPKKVCDQRGPCGSLRALEHDYLSGFMRRTKSLASENEHRFLLQLGLAAAGKQCYGLHGEALVFLEL